MPDTDLIRTVVADDEPESRAAVLTLLAEVPSVEVVAEARNGSEAVEMVRRLRPDLLFLDIQMPELDGFAVLEELGDDMPRGVVLVTAYDEYALRAFEVHALDYVLKPFGRRRFLSAVSRALERLAAQDALVLKRTLEDIVAGRKASRDSAPDPWSLTERSRRDSPGDPSARFGIRKGTRVVLIDPEKIDWIEAVGDYARVHVEDEAHLVSERMHELERRLGPRAFLRIHRSLIVNLNRVGELRREADGSGCVVLETGVRLRVARSRWPDLESAIGLR